MSSTNTPAIYYHPDGFETSRSNLMGRHAAGEEFLKALCKSEPDEPLYCYAYQQKHFEHFVQKVRGFTPNNRKLIWIPWSRWNGLGETGSLFTPGPVLHDLAWQRRYSNQRLFSICGVTHTTATSRVMDALGELLISPVQPWDAIICTSECVRQTVKRAVNDQYSYLKERLGPGIMPPSVNTVASYSAGSRRAKPGSAR
jgi:alpha-maltose-1-phosphate synthase